MVWERQRWCGERLDTVHALMSVFTPFPFPPPSVLSKNATGTKLGWNRCPSMENTLTLTSQSHRHRQADRQTQTDRQTDTTHTRAHTHTHTQTNKHTHTHKDVSATYSTFVEAKVPRRKHNSAKRHLVVLHIHHTHTEGQRHTALSAALYQHL